MGRYNPPKGLETIFKRPDGPDLSTENGFGCQGPDVATIKFFCSEVPYNNQYHFFAGLGVTINRNVPLVPLTTGRN